jgi:hypothetical protein
MLQGSGGRYFLNEPVGAEHCGELRFENLEGDVSFVLEIFCEIDSRHTPFAEEPLNSVTVGECITQTNELRIRVFH